MKTTLLTIAVLMFTIMSCGENSLAPENDYGPEPSVSLVDMNGVNSLAKTGFTTGFDQWGFNYRAHIFKGYLINSMIGDPKFETFPHYRHEPYLGNGLEFRDNFIEEYGYWLLPDGLLDCKLIMSWNESLLSKTGVYPDSWDDTDAYIQFKYTMDTEDGKWMQIRKLVAIQSGDYVEDGLWYNQEGQEKGMVSYYWPDELIIVHVINTGNNPFVPDIMPPDYKSPKGHGWGK